MLQYTNGTPLAIGAKTVGGRSLAHVKWSSTTRAFAAADFVRGDLEIIDFTVLQAVMLFKVSQAYISAALRCDPAARREIEAGSRPLIVPHPKATADRLLRNYTTASPEELDVLRRTVGAAQLWDALIEPAL